VTCLPDTSGGNQLNSTEQAMRHSSATAKVLTIVWVENLSQLNMKINRDLQESNFKSTLRERRDSALGLA